MGFVGHACHAYLWICILYSKSKGAERLSIGCNFMYLCSLGICSAVPSGVTTHHCATSLCNTRPQSWKQVLRDLSQYLCSCDMDTSLLVKRLHISESTTKHFRATATSTILCTMSHMTYAHIFSPKSCFCTTLRPQSKEGPTYGVIQLSTYLETGRELHHSKHTQFPHSDKPELPWA